jgi:hypothetical protein
MDADSLRAWFDEYIDAFAASARRETDVKPLLDFYAVPLTVTTGSGAVTLTTEDQVASTVQGQVDALHAQGYAGTTVTALDVSVLNASSALLRTALTRLDADGRELNAIAMTYLVTEQADDRRIAAMLVHS